MKPQHILKHPLTWMVSVMTGFATVAGGYVLYHHTQEAIPKQVVLEALDMGVKPTELNALHKIDAKMFAKKPLTPAEWQQYKGFATGSHPGLKHVAARHLGAAQGSAYAQEALAIAKSLTNDQTDARTRANALLSIYALQDPEWKSIAQKFLSDPQKAPRQMAAAMIEKDRRK